MPGDFAARAQTPQDDGGARGWIATANQRITAPGYPHFLTQDWALPYRYQRIEQQLEARRLHDLPSLRALQGDTVSPAALRLLRAASVVTGRREGRNVYYRLSDAHVPMLLDVTREHAVHGTGTGEDVDRSGVGPA